jgi:sugar/nucleoside kinase (ribokinase family)
VGGRLKKLGVLGTMIWDTIVGRDPAESPLEEWGGIGYALAGLDASLPPDWEIVPIAKVGRDLAGRANAFLRELRAAGPSTRFVEVPAVNPRVRLNYRDRERRCEHLRGGVPPWTWDELGPMVMDLDGLYVNFITGFECDLGTAQALRRAFRRPLYGDLHSLALGMRPDGERHYRPVDEPLAWLACFDIAQVNEDEMGQLGDDPLALAAHAVEHGARAVCVTLGAHGAVYVAAPGFDGFAAAAAPPAARRPVLRTARIEPEGAEAIGDPTGCGDVFGATLFARLLAGADLETAIRDANRAAKRNVSYRGASGLQHYLRGALAPTARR